MRTIIAGSRGIYDYALLCTILEEDVHWPITEVVCGGARGVDTMGRSWAIEHGVPVKEFPADWKLYGKRAGYIRNKEMAKYAEALVALWDGKSKGTKHMIDTANQLGLRSVVWTPDTE